jgi:superfamily I DNA/RNA helicase
VLGKRADLHANTKVSEEPVRVLEFHDYYAEYHFLVSEIQKKIADGIPAQEIAVLCRNNRDLFPLITVFEQYGVAINIESDQNLFADPHLRKLILLFRTICNFGNDIFLTQLLHADFLQIDPFDVYRLMVYVGKNQTTLYELLSKDDQTRRLRGFGFC